MCRGIWHQLSVVATTLIRVPDATSTPTHVLTREAVRWSIDTLGALKLHPTFVMYLYLRKEHRAGRLAEASAKSHDLESLIKMPGNPAKPFYFPLIDRGARSGNPLPTFWRAENISGSWSPGSIYRQKHGHWMGLEGGGYTMPDDHVELALRDLLYEAPVPALAMGCYFMRNDGFVLAGRPTAHDVISGFRTKFDYSADTQGEFNTLYTTNVPDDVGFSWFEPFAADPSLASDMVEESSHA